MVPFTFLSPLGVPHSGTDFYTQDGKALVEKAG